MRSRSPMLPFDRFHRRSRPQALEALEALETLEALTSADLRRLIKARCAAEAEVVKGFIPREMSATMIAERMRSRPIPRATTDNTSVVLWTAVCTSAWSLWIDPLTGGTTAGVAPAVPVSDPLIAVPCHIKETIASRWAAADDPDATFLGVTATLSDTATSPASIFDDRALTGCRSSPPRKRISLCPARALLPFRFCRQMFPLRATVAARIKPAHSVDRLPRSIEVSVARACSLTASAPYAAPIFGDCDLVLVKKIALEPDPSCWSRIARALVATHREGATLYTAHPRWSFFAGTNRRRALEEWLFRGRSSGGSAQLRSGEEKAKDQEDRERSET